MKPVGKKALWFGQVDATNTTIWAQFKGVNPNENLVEINVRRTVFYPDKPGRNYISVRGFTMRQAATPWAPPTAEQIGLIGTHWSKGWIIESNTISHSICSGIALGKYGDKWDNRAGSAEGYVGTIHRALSNGWNKANIGGHIVRDNTISHCEQTGIVGSLGCSYSSVIGNTIHDIHVRKLFGGAEMAGIKFHGAIDVEISRNHISRTQGHGAIWLDWMAQGTRVSRNLFHDNNMDLFVEVNHGPFLVDNNLFLSAWSLSNWSQGGAYVHNLIAGKVRISPFDSRQTPFLEAHSTTVAGLHDNPTGDDRYYSNIFVKPARLSVYDETKVSPQMGGNVFLAGAVPSRHEKAPILRADYKPAIKVVEQANGVILQIRFDKDWSLGENRPLVTKDLLGTVIIPKLQYENADGSPVCIDVDYFGKVRNAVNPTPGPFEVPGDGLLEIKVW
jgi:hypothetical protein